MRSWILDETNPLNEFQNVERFRLHLARYFPHGRVRDLGKIIVPKTYSELSRGRVLTMGRLKGITVNDWIRGKRPDLGTRYDPRTSILTLIVSSFRPLFVGQPCLFHGDPHPANIILMEGGNVGLIDFGLIGHYSEELMPAFNKMFFASYLRDAPMFTESLIRLVNISDTRYDELLPDVEAFMNNAVDRGFGGMLIGLLQILRKHKLPGPTLLPIIGKFNVLLDSLAHRFCPAWSTADMLREEFELALSPKSETNHLDKERGGL